MCLQWSAGDKLTNSLHMIAELFPLNAQEELLMRQLDGMADEKQKRIPQCLHSSACLFSSLFTSLFCHECNNKLTDYFLHKEKNYFTDIYLCTSTKFFFLALVIHSNCFWELHKASVIFWCLHVVWLDFSWEIHV